MDYTIFLNPNLYFFIGAFVVGYWIKGKPTALKDAIKNKIASMLKNTINPPKV